MASETQPDLDKHYTKNRFHNRVYIVTGGASGIGLATVERLCNDGAKVAFFDLNEESGKTEQTRLQAEGHRVRFLSVDVSKEEECVRGVQEVVQEFGETIHGLVNNAGLLQVLDKGEDVTAADFDNIMGINLRGSLNMVKCCLPYLRKGNDVAIVNNCSVLAERVLPGSWAYNASKGGLRSLTKSMALDLSAYGIRVNSVSPGAIWTNMQKSRCASRSEIESKLNYFSMMKRLADASEVAAAIVFLLSKDASFITGADLPVDGGTGAMCPPLVE